MLDKPKIWIIDDDKIIGNIVCDYLRMHSSYDPYYFESAMQAQKVLKKIKPDIMLVDWIMPQCSGLDFIEILRKKKKTADIPIFMLTGLRTGQEFENACNRAHLEGYFTKPVDLPRLHRRLKYFFEKKSVA